MMKRLLAFLALVAVAHGAGSVQQSIQQLGQTNNWVVAFQWTGDASTGSVPNTVALGLNCCQGYLVVQVETAPGTPNPTAGYSVQIQDASGADTLNGAAASLSATTPQSFAASTSAPPLQGILTLVITGQNVASAKGIVYVFLSKPGSVNLATLGRGAIASSANWLTLANTPVFDNRTYNYVAQSPGGSLPSGACNFNMFPLPAGVVTGGSVYISGGVGTAEALTNVTVSGNNVSGTCANTHSGAWTVQSASGGAQEAICAMPAAGGTLLMENSFTLNANVTTCAKTAVVANRLAGSVITNAATFTILNTFPTGFAKAIYTHTPPNLSTLNTLYNGTQFDIGGYPDGFQNGFTTAPVTQALVGSVNAATNPASTMNSFGVAGYSRTAGQNVMGVAVYGGGTCSGALTQCWGANFDAQHDTNGVGGGAMVGGEFDIGHSATGGNAAATLKGVTSVLFAITAPTGFSHAYEAIRDGPTHFQWNAGFQADAGCCNVAFIASPLHETNNSVSSEPIQLIGRDAGGTTHTATLQADLSGNLGISAAANQTVAIGPGPTATTVAFNSSGASVMSTTGSIIVGQISASTIMFAIDTGANNAIAGTVANPPALANGLRISVFLTHTLQAGANTFAYNGGAAVAIKSHRNTANNIATAYANGVIDLFYDGTQWEDLSQ